ncbi:YbjN domain-containing protein [Rhodobaculum claviforme]|uniref:Diacylglyceryl transferase n=1 Tax=Rhodobaculum claviforme TaxID=1549854 RepID=A0A934WFG5_9RHOB|nr:YbjN domain-containing protein [Rhodobaculum claviforme]MBK5926700.1 diacylglyceryl transferase [Rhodobaculum claviforme]
MSLSEPTFPADDIHPIDIVETLAEHRAWEFDRVGDDRIAMAVEGQWRTYSLTLAWSPGDEMLRLVCTFELAPPEDRQAALMDILNRINDRVWAGAFTLWPDEGLMVWRHGLLLSGGQVPAPEQIDRMISAAVSACERYYPALQLVCWAGTPPQEALGIAIAEAYGRA